MPGISQRFFVRPERAATWGVLLRYVEKRQINGSQYETLGGNAPSRHTGRLGWFFAGVFGRGGMEGEGRRWMDWLYPEVMTTN